MRQARVFIVLATCQGERYLRQQVESLQAQTRDDWRLLAHDDHSDDATPAILRELADEDARIEILDNRSAERLGPAGSFGFLLQAAYAGGADITFLCDQDDVWRSDKVARLAAAFAADPDTPHLVYSDLAVADADLEIRHPSFMTHQDFRHPAHDALAVLLVQNVVTGCAAAVNRPLLDLALPIPATVVNHDWWLAVTAAAAGALSFVPEPLVTYRQHAANVVGALDRRRLAADPLGSARRIVERHRRILAGNVTALRELTARLQGRGRAASAAVARIATFVDIVADAGGKLGKMGRLRRAGFWPQNWKRRVLLLQSLGED